MEEKGKETREEVKKQRQACRRDKEREGMRLKKGGGRTL